MKLEVVILAAGQGTRMRSSLPKVLHPLASRPLLAHVLDSARALSPIRLHVVVGHGADTVRETLDAPDIEWVMQTEQLGTGHAVLQALPRPCQWEKVLWAPVRRTTPLPRPYRRYLWSQPPAPPLLV